MTYRVITGVLKARTALHVGSGEGREVADALLRRDADGNLLVPGTAIAGALRSLLTRLAPRIEGAGICRALYPESVLLDAPLVPCGCAVCRLMGDVVPSDEGEDEARASRLLVFNAPMVEGQPPMIRDRVGINRVTGAAARSAAAKFDLEVLPAGARFAMRMELCEPPDEDSLVEDERLLIVGLSEWAAGRLYVGGGGSRGLGAFELDDLTYIEQDLNDSTTLMSFLQADKPWENETESKDVNCRDVTQRLMDRVCEINVLDVNLAEAKALDTLREIADIGDVADVNLPLTTGWITWELALQAEGPLLTHDPNAAGLNGFNHAPLLDSLGDWQHPVLPGSGLRGVLRSQAERIARTLITRRALTKEGEAPGDYFLEHCPACDPLASRRPDAVRGVVLESCDSLLRHQKALDENREVQPEDLCLACQLFGSTRNGSRLRVEDAPFSGDNLVYKMLDFLAVDRFTGGGAEHLKFNALALWRPAFTLRLSLDSPRDWELGWLALVLRDLAEGWLRVGYGAAKGLGKVKISGGEVTLASLPPGIPSKEGASIFTIQRWSWGDTDFLAQQDKWVDAFHHRLEKVDGYRVSQEMALPADSYFDGSTSKLYPVVGRLA